MSTDLNNLSLLDIDTGEDLLKYLAINKELMYEGQRIGDLLPKLFAACKEIWRFPEETKYPDHGIGHSLRIIGYFMDLEELYGKWSNIEKLLFASVALIHDLGMQVNEWKLNPELFDSKDFSFLRQGIVDSDTVRDAHEEIVCELILAETEGRLEGLEFPPRLFNSSNVGEKILMNIAATIAACHRNSRYQHIVATDNKFSEIATAQRENYRPKLLAGLIRLCDALDGTAARLTERNKIRLIPEESRKHWLACMFVSRIRVVTTRDGNKRHAQIIHEWRVPKNATQEQEYQIQHFIDKERIGFINREISKIDEFYREAGEALHQRSIEAKTHDVKPIHEFIDAPFDLYDQMPKRETEIAQLLVQNQRASEPSEVTERALPRVILSKTGQTVEKELLDWYEKNKTTGHHELANGEHTDTLLQLRTLASNPRLLSLIVEHLAQKFKERNITPTLILAVGTSAIPISVNLALKLKCASTFTFFTGAFDIQYTGKYQGLKAPVFDVKNLSFESRPSITDNEVIVVVDDVISGGFAASITVETILAANPEFKPKLIYHQAIFKLGRREDKLTRRDRRIKDFFHIVHIPDVIYAEEKCEACEQGGVASPEN